MWAGSGLAVVGVGTGLVWEQLCLVVFGAGHVTSPPLSLHPIFGNSHGPFVQGTRVTYLQSHSWGSHMTCLCKLPKYPYMVIPSLDVSCDLPVAGISKIGLVVLTASGL